MTKILAVIFVILALPNALHAAENAQITMLGLFHFSNPGLDKVKTDQIDVTTAANQRYLDNLSNKLQVEFKPTAVLVECPPSTQNNINTQFQQYLSGSFELPINETYQIGFRVAKGSGIAQVTCYDEKQIQWQPAKMMQLMAGHEHATQAKFDNFIQSITNKLQSMQASMSLRELLIAHNQPDFDNLNKSFYLLTSSVGAGKGFEGADAAASWWHRNFRMYANIQKVAVPGSRVLVIGGQGHTAILKGFAAIDPARELVDIKQYL